METQEIECCIRGYHVYQDIWEAAVAARHSLQRWPLRWRNEIAPSIGVRQDRAKPEEQCGSRIVETSS